MLVSKFEVLNHAYLNIAADNTFRTSITSPNMGGKMLTSKSVISRTGEKTYTATASFNAAYTQCAGQTSFEFTKLDDGGLVLVVKVPKRVKAIIVGRCVWDGEVTHYYELKPIE